MNYYKKITDFIKRKYNKENRIMLVKYLNSEVFQDDLDRFMNNQANSGEPIDRMFASECIIESYAQNDEELNEGLTRFSI